MKDYGVTLFEHWHDLNGANAAPTGMKWQSNGKSRFSGEYMHRLVKKDTDAKKAEAEAEKPNDTTAKLDVDAWNKRAERGEDE